jgi:hypothetical protein
MPNENIFIICIEGEAERKAKEEKAEQEILAEKRAEKKAAEEARTETPNDTVRATGTDVKTATQRVIAASLGVSMAIGESFDIKA